MSYAIGIDLGTTNSVVSVYRRGVVETISVDGRSAVPSVVSVRQDGSMLVGQMAKARMILDPDNTISSAKLFMGDPKKVYHIGNKSFCPEDIGSIILKRMVKAAKDTIGQEIKDAVITVPAYFDEKQRAATKKAGEEAGLNVLRLIPEPTAAAISYGLDKGKDQTLMVYDLGGGTFDISILEVRGNNFQVKAVGGDTKLGGDNFDQAIVTWVANKIKQQTGIDIIQNSNREALLAKQRLKEAAEMAKIELSQSDRAQIAIPDCMGQQVALEITLQEYNDLIKPLLDRTIACMRTVLRDAKLNASDIDRVILVGGSTKNRAVRDVVAKEIKEPYVSDRVDEAVSHGAAIVAANLFLPDLDALPIEISDVTGHSLGIDMRNDNNELFFKPIIPRQTVYPCRRGILGFTMRPSQTEVEMNVFRGEEKVPSQNTYLGELQLNISPPQKDIIPIAAIFELDADGIIHFTGVQLPSLKESRNIIDYAEKNDGELAIALIDELISCGRAKTKSVDVGGKDHDNCRQK